MDQHTGSAQEFFTRLDPMYRSYAKQEALKQQRTLFDRDPPIEVEWIAYKTSFKALSHYVKHVVEPFDVPITGGRDLAAPWADRRTTRAARRAGGHPYRHQGSADLNTYKLFLELAHSLLGPAGRLGMLVPSGVYTDKGTTALRRLFLGACQWEWLYGFENRLRIFPIHSSFKFATLVVQAGGATETLQAAFMRHDTGEWERPEAHAITIAVSDVQRFSPSTWSFLELRDHQDLALAEKLYGEHELLGAYCERNGASYSSEFHMTNASKHFTPRAKLPNGLIAADEDTRDPRVRARLRVAGFVPLYEGKSFYLHNPYALGKGQKDSVGNLVKATVAGVELGHQNWRLPRLTMRNIGRSTDQRTYVVGLMPPAAHANSAPTLDGMIDAEALEMKALLASLAIDYITRMKVSANLNWFYLETLPIPYWTGTPFADHAGDLVLRLNAIGADFPEPAANPLIAPDERLAARLVLDALVADLYGLERDDLAHIATRFPIYDKHAGEHRYTELVVPVYEAFLADGYEGAQAKATALAAARNAAGVGFGLDELWVPPGGWAQANEEARQLLVAAGDPVT